LKIQLFVSLFMILASKRTIKNLLRKHDIRPSKKLGQNFLIDKIALKKIVIAAKLSSEDTILEIGPGLGTLTMKSREMCIILKQNLKDYKNVEIINQDILEVRLPTFYVGSRTSHIKIVANLPYYITSPVIRKFLEVKNPPKEMILMVQKEVAQRIVTENH